MQVNLARQSPCVIKQIEEQLRPMVRLLHEKEYRQRLVAACLLYVALHV